jgi:predicted double-glycine peptidase
MSDTAGDNVTETDSEIVDSQPSFRTMDDIAGDSVSVQDSAHGNISGEGDHSGE